MPSPLPRIPSRQDIYNAIMKTIELELASGATPTLYDKYANRSPEGQSERGKRYRRGFAKYDKAYAEHLADLEKRVHQHGVEARYTFEGINREQNVPAPFSFESAIQTE